jgi:hypothetical protein
VAGVASMYLNGALMSFTRTSDSATVTSIAIDSTLTASTLHGLAVDTHLEKSDPARVGADNEFALPVVSDSWFTGIS